MSLGRFWEPLGGVSGRLQESLGLLPGLFWGILKKSWDHLGKFWWSSSGEHMFNTTSISQIDPAERCGITPAMIWKTGGHGPAGTTRRVEPELVEKHALLDFPHGIEHAEKHHMSGT